MIETQEKWYLPAPRLLGWHIGFWNLVGVRLFPYLQKLCLNKSLTPVKGIGFTLCGALGFAASNSGCLYQGSLATFWGSWCFLVGSIIQWYECLDKHPVDVEEDGGCISDTEAVV
jgi:hypothetical protein